MIISTIKHAVQTHETQQMAPVNRSESLFSVRIPRSKVHATRDTLRLPRKPIETLTRDTRRARVQCTKNRTEEREREGEKWRKSVSWWNSCPWHWTHCGMRVHFRSRSSATRRCRGQLWTFKARKKRGKRRCRYFLHAQRGGKHRRRQHPDICQPTGFIDSLSVSVSISFQTLDRLPYRCRSISLFRFPRRINAGLNS